MVTPALRSAALLAALGVGWFVAWRAELSDVEGSSAYSLFITALLGFGLYASTSGIVIDEFRRELRTVVLAVTLGVLAKVALIFGVMFLVYRQPEHLVFAVAVAQIDPLSVAAVRAKSKMSDSAKALLSAWASFDDPITVLLTVYITSFALQGGAVGGSARSRPTSRSTSRWPAAASWCGGWCGGTGWPCPAASRGWCCTPSRRRSSWRSGTWR
nr:hypothetical protein GCM10017745_29400 [Saccharothrix mutabilis subsp. capreolus]